MIGRSAARVIVLSAVCMLSATWGIAQEPQARSLWQQGQAAQLRGDHPQSIDLYRRCLKLDPSYVRVHLSLAAAYLEHGDERLALPHLATYVREAPEHVLIRMHYAELLFRLQQFQEAREQFEKFIDLAQDCSDITPSCLIEVHSKL